MKITALTCAVHRPEAWRLCELYMSRQTVKPHQWIVLDDDLPKTVCTMGQDYIHCPEFKGPCSMAFKVWFAITEKLIRGDVLVFIENDDWYSPVYLDRVCREIDGYDLAGEGRAIYYNVRYRRWCEHNNEQHSSLCSTAIKTTSAQHVLDALDPGNPFLDERLWRNSPVSKNIYLPKIQRMVVGIKGMPGPVGLGDGHGETGTPDPDLSKLRTLIGDDTAFYEQQSQRH